LILSRKYAAVLLAALAGAAAAVYSSHAQPQDQTPSPAPQQTPAASAMNHNLVVLDPAHGGPDAGASLADRVPEKFTTLALAAQLRTALTAAGFTVVVTREGDSSDPLTTDQRAEIANRAHAVACIVLHATNTGSGVHVYTSPLQPSDTDEEATRESPFVPLSWETAQAGSIRQSQRLADDVKSALTAGNLPAAIGKAPVRPLDNMMCPAIAVEIAPLTVAGSDSTAVTDATYQQRITDSLAKAINTWRTHADPPTPNAAATPEIPAAQASAASKAKAAAEVAGRAASSTHIQAGPKTAPPIASPDAASHPAQKGPQ
jgi:N-acetylmuramoyl-L-alanine amidase